MRNRTPEFFCCAMLVLASSAKGAAIIEWSPAIKNHDPLLMVPTYCVYIVSLVVEAYVAVMIAFSRNAKLNALALLWITTLFGIYHLGGIVANVSEPCPCIGAALDFIPYLKGHSNLVSRIYFLVFAGFTALIVKKTFQTDFCRPKHK
jgi:hypothetical protein